MPAPAPDQPPPRRDRPPARTLAALAVIGAALLFGTWTLLVGQLDVQDAVGSVVAATAAIWLGWLVNQRGRAVPAFRRRDAGALLGAVGRTVTETIGVLGAAARAGLGRPVASEVVDVPTDVRGGGWAGARRAAVVTALRTFAPGTVVIDLDTEDGTATVHRLAARGGAPR